MKELVEMFINKAPGRILDTLLDGRKNIMEITRVTGLTYSHVLKLVYYFNEEGLVDLSQEGRLTYVSLSEKGMEIAKLIRLLREKINNLKNSSSQPITQ
jgi:DNA-binding transcriptional ArsR family regulator